MRIGEVLGRQLGHARADRIGDQRPLLRLRFRLTFDARFLRRVHVDGDGEVHVEQDRLDQRSERLSGLGRPILASTAHEPLGPSVGHDGLDQVIENDCVAADVPARLQADARMRETDGADLGDVAIVEVAGADGRPVIGLCALGPRHVGFVLEEVPHLRGCAQLAVELVEASGQLAVDERLEGTDALAALGIELHELHAIGEL